MAACYDAVELMNASPAQFARLALAMADAAHDQADPAALN
jgi:hypothetical protein